MSNVPTNLIPSTITQLPEYQGSSTLGYFAYSLEGRSYKVQFSQLAAVGAVPSTRVIAAGTGLTGGGDLSQDRVISIANGGVGTAQLADSGVIAGSYGSGTDVPVLTVDAKGRITAASTTPLSISGYVPTSRTITTGAGLLGGGSLASNLTLTVDFYASAPQALGSASPGVSNAAARGDHVHPAVDLSDTDQTQGALPLGRGGTGDALSPVAGAVVYSTGTKFALADPGIPGQVLTSDGAGEPYWQTISGTGTVTDVSVATANGFAGTVANPNTTPAITVSTTVTGVVKGNGTALSAAVAGTDYVAPGAITGSGLTMATSRLLGRTTASTGAVEEITVGAGLSLSGGSLVNSAPDQIVSLTGAGTTVVTGTYPNFTITSNDQYTGTVTSVAASGGTTGLSFSGSPITTSGTLTLGGTLVVANGGTGATTAAGARTNLGAAASGANSDITSLSGITGGIATPDYIDFDTTAAPARATGRLWWDNADGIQTLNLGMAGSNATLQIGEETYFRIKASSAITEGQVVMFTGSVGNSGALTGAPATGLTKDTASYVMGVATEDIALNGWGYVTQFGLVRNIDTTGGAEAWVDGQILYYDPAVAGGLTKNVPSAPNAKVEVAAVITAASNGSLFIRPIARFALGQLNDVETAAATNLDLLQYNSSGGYWQHVAPSTITVGTATNLAGGAANRIAYQTGSGTTGFITAPSVANTFLEWSGSGFQWSSNPLGTVTSVDVSGGTTGLTTSGGPITSSGTITLAGTLNVANGGTGATSLTSGYLVKGNGTSAVSASAIYQSGTDILIGTTTPDQKLTVAGAVAATGYVIASTTNFSLVGYVNGNAYVGLYNSTGSGGTTNTVTIGTGNTERMRVDSSGNVGIGTSSPTNKLDVVGSVNIGAALITGTGVSTGDAQIELGGNRTGNGASYIDWHATAGTDYELRLARYGGANGGVDFLNTGTGNFSIGQLGAAPLLLLTSGSERMRIDSIGYVGIGTSSPTSRLTITGGVTEIRDGNYFMLRPAGNAWDMRLQATGTQLDILSGGALGSPIMSLVNGGNVGIGTSSPDRKLVVSGSSVSMGLYATNGGNMSIDAPVSGIAQIDVSGANAFRVNTNGAERMRIDSSGNVGIGTSSPVDKLNVSDGTATFQFKPLGGSSIGYMGMRTNHALGFTTNDTERMRITGAGDVGIGTSSPVGVSGYGWLTVNGANSAMSFSRSNTEHFRIQAISDAAYLNCIANIAMLFNTNNTERMRIGPNGGVAIGGTGTDASLHIQQAYGGYNRLTQMAPSGTSNNAFNLMAAKNSGGSDNWWSWGVRTDSVWSLVPGVDSALTSSTGIYFDSTAQAYKPGGGSWQATSDARVKTNIAPITDAASRIMALRPSSFDYRAPEAHAGRVSDRGFIAQEFEEVYPHSVSSIGLMCDEEKVFFAEGEEMKTLGLNNDFFADLVALVQEQQETINDLRARVAQLEGN